MRFWPGKDVPSGSLLVHGALTLSPATQIANKAGWLVQDHDNIELDFIVRANKMLQISRDWMKGHCDIVEATPGSLLDLLAAELRKGLASTQIVGG